MSVHVVSLCVSWHGESMARLKTSVKNKESVWWLLFSTRAHTNISICLPHTPSQLKQHHAFYQRLLFPRKPHFRILPSQNKSAAQFMFSVCCTVPEFKIWTLFTWHDSHDASPSAVSMWWGMGLSPLHHMTLIGRDNIIILPQWCHGDVIMLNSYTNVRFIYSGST